MPPAKQVGPSPPSESAEAMTILWLPEMRGAEAALAQADRPEHEK